ncbi:MAG: adenylate kinase [Peptococcaceae bacterium]|jgi:adenylate kinase|nr:adenylate kinase [Peptococcaceae bacterium]
MNIVLMGPPGAGKGTQADVMARNLFVPHISTGDIFRANIKAGTELGQLANQYISKGDLVPDEVTLAMIKDRLAEDDCAKGFILDGLPRTIGQADALEAILAEQGKQLDKVVNIDVPEELLIARLCGRRVCRNCSQTYHLENNPPTEAGRCDECGGELYQRADDSEETIKNRLEVYRAQSEPLIAYYEQKGLLLSINGNQTINNVLMDIGKGLGQNW